MDGPDQGRRDAAHHMNRAATQKKKKRHRKEAMEDGATVREAAVMNIRRIEPLIIHSVSPPVFYTDASDFMRTVQILTGCPETRRRCEDVAIIEEMLDDGDPSPATSCGSPTPASSPCSSISSAATSTELLRKMAMPSPSSSSHSGLFDGPDCFLSMDSAVSRQSQHYHDFADSGPCCRTQDLEPSIMEMELRDWLSSYDQDGYWSNCSVFEHVDDPLCLQ